MTLKKSIGSLYISCNGQNIWEIVLTGISVIGPPVLAFSHKPFVIDNSLTKVYYLPTVNVKNVLLVHSWSDMNGKLLKENHAFCLPNITSFVCKCSAKPQTNCHQPWHTNYLMWPVSWYACSEVTCQDQHLGQMVKSYKKVLKIIEAVFFIKSSGSWNFLYNNYIHSI